MAPTLRAAISLIDKSIGVTPSIGFPQKHLANPLFKQDKAWEPRIDNGYPNAFIGADGKTMELYYGTCQKDCSVQLLLFANSTDGIRWLKPNLGIYDIAHVRPDLKAIGRRNNVLCEGGGIGVMCDAGRYIAFGPGCYSASASNRGCAMTWGMHEPKAAASASAYPHEDLAFSSDGLHWENATSVAWPSPQRWDCHNNLLHDGDRWVATTRDGFSAPPGRAIGMAASMPGQGIRFDTTRAPRLTLEGTLQAQLYSQLTFKWLDVYLGLVMVYDAASADQKVHCRLAWSKSATDWWQWVEGPAGLTTGRDFIALGGAGEFDSHICFASKPVAMPTEERLYYMGGNGPHSGARNSSFGLATLRKDGFAGLSAWTGHGSVTLLPLVVTGASLVVTADFNPSAGAQQELGVTLGTASRLFIGVVDGPRDLSLEMAIPLTSNATAAPASWRSNASFADLVGTEVRLELVLQGAMVYALGFV